MSPAIVKYPHLLTKNHCPGGTWQGPGIFMRHEINMVVLSKAVLIKGKSFKTLYIKRKQLRNEKKAKCTLIGKLKRETHWKFHNCIRIMQNLTEPLKCCYKHGPLHLFKT